MGRLQSMILLSAITGAAGCHGVRHVGGASDDGYSKVTFQVQGMMKTKSGAT